MKNEAKKDRPAPPWFDRIPARPDPGSLLVHIPRVGSVAIRDLTEKHIEKMVAHIRTGAEQKIEEFRDMVRKAQAALRSEPQA